MTSRTLLAWVALAATALLTSTAFSTVWADGGDTPPTGDQSGWEHLREMRDIMHYATFNAEPRQEGVRVTITSTQPELVTAIQHEFSGERHPQRPVYPNTEMAAQILENGVALDFTSPDEATVQQLQRSGTGLAYGLLRDNMRQARVGADGFGRNCGRGYGGGMMGWNGGFSRSAGPQQGMMGGGYSAGPQQGMMGGGYGAAPRWE